ncbi:MAG: hypothetical protein IJ222_00340 [Bacteroidales bacterium]|nr:hypothetical protein [Bacteroidales bacterium]
MEKNYFNRHGHIILPRYPTSGNGAPSMTRAVQLGWRPSKGALDARCKGNDFFGNG